MEKPAFWNHDAAYYPWVRKLPDRRELPGAKLRSGLYYRRLLSWIKP